VVVVAQRAATETAGLVVAAAERHGQAELASVVLPELQDKVITAVLTKYQVVVIMHQVVVVEQARQ
jgi:hypothetical protein